MAYSKSPSASDWAWWVVYEAFGLALFSLGWWLYSRETQKPDDAADRSRLNLYGGVLLMAASVLWVLFAGALLHPALNLLGFGISVSKDFF